MHFAGAFICESIAQLRTLLGSAAFHARGAQGAEVQSHRASKTLLGDVMLVKVFKVHQRHGEAQAVRSLHRLKLGRILQVALRPSRVFSSHASIAPVLPSAQSPPPLRAQPQSSA